MASSASESETGPDVAGAEPATGADAAATSATSGRRPLIGLPTYYGRTKYGVWDRDGAFLPSVYATAVTRAGGRVVLMPPEQPWSAAEVAQLDGVILTGGDDVDPALYGEERGAHTQTPNTRRDSFETQLYRDARAAGVPVLGICRGAQVINTVHGGTLHQHLPDVDGLDAHEAEVKDRFAEVVARTVPGSAVAGVVGAEVDVRCHHHQSIDRLGEGLSVSARSDDGGIEAIETPDADVLAVQWHPEETLDDLRLFRALVDSAAARAAGTSLPLGGGATSATGPDSTDHDNTASDVDDPGHQGVATPTPAPAAEMEETR